MDGGRESSLAPAKSEMGGAQKCHVLHLVVIILTNSAHRRSSLILLKITNQETKTRQTKQTNKQHHQQKHLLFHSFPLRIS